MTPPGLATVSVSTDAWAAVEKDAPRPRYYFDWERDAGAPGAVRSRVHARGLDRGRPRRRARDCSSRRGSSRRSSATRVLAGHAAPASRRWDWSCSRRTTTAARSSLPCSRPKASTPARSSHSSATATGSTLAPGQGPLKGRVFRIGHIGWFDIFDITTALGGLELALVELGTEIERGLAVTACARRVRDGRRAAESLRSECSSANQSRTPGSSSCATTSTSSSTGRPTLAEGGDRRLRWNRDPVRRRSLRRTCWSTPSRLKVIGRAGVGVDNVDVEAATRRGIVVANAPESTVISAAEHTLALLLALARHVPEAHAALKQGRWERSSLRWDRACRKDARRMGFGRIGQQVARGALALEMRRRRVRPVRRPSRPLPRARRRAARSAERAPTRRRRLSHPALAPHRTRLG